MRRKHYKAIGIDQDIDATCHSRGSGHNTARKCRAVKRKTSKRMRQVLRQELKEESVFQNRARKLSHCGNSNQAGEQLMTVAQAPVPEQVIDDIQAERLYQLQGGREGKLAGESGWSYEFDDKNTINDWAAYIQIYLGRAVQTSNEMPDSEFRKNMVKVATLAAAAVEAVDRGATPARHYDNDR